MMKICAAALLLATATPLAAQRPPTPEMAAAARTAMNEVAFLVGDWVGSGWMMDAGGERHEFLQRERIRALQDGQVILIEGRGMEAADTTNVVHDAVAFIGYDAVAKQYVMRSFLPGGRTTEAEVEAADGRIVWRIGSTVRYTIDLDDAGTWHEIGEFTRDQGRTWQQFIEMRLVRRQ